MEAQQNKTIMSRREKISKAGSTVFIAVAIAAVIVAFSAVSIRFLWQKKNYNDRVITAKTKARDDLRTNLANIDKLAEQFPALEQSATANSKIILHALPPTYDYPALATSMQSLAQLSGVQFSGGVGDDNSASAIKSSETSSPQEIPLNLSVEGSYDAVVQYIKNLERSIRPILISSVSYSGTNDQLKADIQATTYYQPTRSLDVSRSEVK